MNQTTSERPIKAEQFNKYGCLKLSFIVGAAILAMTLLAVVILFFTTGNTESLRILLPINLLLIIGMVLLAGMLAYLLGVKERSFRAGCRQTQGTVVDKQIFVREGVTSGSEVARQHHIFYTFPEGKGQDGKPLRYRQTVERADYERLALGAVVTVAYRPENPARSRLADLKDPVSIN
ncbi:MAG: DUF3592 domain-containing protein [Anaerolineae bacterium]